MNGGDSLILRLDSSSYYDLERVGDEQFKWGWLKWVGWSVCIGWYIWMGVRATGMELGNVI